MYTIIIKYQNINKEKRTYFWTILLSVIIHLIFLLIFSRDILVIDLSPEEKDLPEEVTVVFPENKPKTIVENINETNEFPRKSDLLSDFNSTARSRQLLEQLRNQPMSKGNIPFPNLTKPKLEQNLNNQFQTKKFTKDALIGKRANDSRMQNQNNQNQQRAQTSQQTTDNIYDQRQFSADQLGDLTLSTYAWEWAPYINALKNKVYSVWFTPAAYHRLGLIHGYTIIEFTISRDGKLLNSKVLEHQGHESLEVSSVNAINASFPFRPLPDNFPDETLTITARLIYPNLRRRN
jgi:outer membrane biosynthesis protein TonB